MKNKHFWPLVITISIIIGFLLSQDGSIPGILGRATGIIIFPGILALIISGILRLFKKKLDASEFNFLFLGIWVLGLLTQIIPYLYETI